MRPTGLQTGGLMMSTTKPEDLKSVSDVVSYFREQQNRNLIPIISGTKEPPKGFPLKKYISSKCDIPIEENQSVAMLHGRVSDTFSLDYDNSKLFEILYDDPTVPLRKGLTIKTPKQGFHQIFTPKDKENGFPPGNWKYFNSEGMEIDIKTEGGYTLLPPSVHPEKQYGNYHFVSDSLEPAKINWPDIEGVLHKKGFFRKDQKRDTNRSIKQYDTDDLLKGGFVQGERRQKQNSLYVKLRIQGRTESETIERVKKINNSCNPPLEEKELDYNCSYAESFFINVVLPKQESRKQNTNDKKPEIDLYEFADVIMSRYNFVTLETREILFYDSGLYKKNGEFVISQLCRKIWRYEKINTSQIAEIQNIIRDKTGYLSADEFDYSTNIINVKNGLYNIKTGEFAEHTPKHLSRIQYPIFYDRTKKCPKFLKFLSSSLEYDVVKISLVLEMMALCFVSENVIEKAFMHVGMGSNGKSVLFNILISMLGKNNITAKTIHDFENNRFAAAALDGKSANISADIGKKGIKNTELIKKLIGGDAIDCEKKFKGPYAFTPFATLIFSANELPDVDDSSDGFARKFELIKWSKQFYGNLRDHTIKNIKNNTDEKSGIFNIVCSIAKRLIETNTLRYESTVEQTRNEWIQEADSVSKFMEKHIVFDPNHFIKKAELYSKYIRFCKTDKFRFITNQKFNDRMVEFGLEKGEKRINGRVERVWFGCMTKDGSIPKNQTTI